MVKRLFKTKNVEYNEVNVDDQPERRQEAFDLCGVLTVPVTVVDRGNGDRSVIVGYNLPQLIPAIR